MQAPPIGSSLQDPRFWAWLALAAWPPALLSWLSGWDLVDPRYLGALLAWWPMDMLGRLGALALLLGPSPRTPRQALGPALAAEVLLGLKAATLALLGLIPALALLSLDRAWTLPAVGLAALGLIPALGYSLKRLLAPLWLLREDLNASAALGASAQQTSGRLSLFLRRLLPWLGLSLGLELLGLGLAEAWGLLLTPLSLALGLIGLRAADRALA
jgi:hypothetical protein